MTMKRSTLISPLLLTALCAAASTAQVIVPVRMSVPVNPVMGLPRMLPSPLTGPLAGVGISMPSPVPALTPAIYLAAAPRVFAARPIRAAAVLPSVRIEAVNENAVNPLSRVAPGLIARFGQKDKVAPQPANDDRRAENDGLNDLFDGTRLPSRAPVVPGRYVSLPEHDLERELGL